MKKTWLFLLSSLIALALTIYSQKSSTDNTYTMNPSWKTFTKNANLEIRGHKTTKEELEVARVPDQRKNDSDEISNLENTRKIASEKTIKDPHFLIREERVLIGDIQKRNYQDEDVPLEMENKINPNWKDILGNELLRFQNNDSKVMIKEEFSIIRIQEDKGQYVEQVIVTYILKNGRINSYRALIDSETGSIIETWDKSVHENLKPERADDNRGFRLPSENNSGIRAR
jgi:hypothetical protein